MPTLCVDQNAHSKDERGRGDEILPGKLLLRRKSGAGRGDARHFRSRLPQLYARQIADPKTTRRLQSAGRREFFSPEISQRAAQPRHAADSSSARADAEGQEQVGRSVVTFSLIPSLSKWQGRCLGCLRSQNRLLNLAKLGIKLCHCFVCFRVTAGGIVQMTTKNTEVLLDFLEITAQTQQNRLDVSVKAIRRNRNYSLGQRIAEKLPILSDILFDDCLVVNVLGWHVHY